MAKDSPRIERVTRIIVPYKKRELAFDGRSEGPGEYPQIGGRLLKRNLKVPIGEYISPLLHAAYFNPKTSNELESEEIRNIMKDKGLWICNLNIWTPEGVYVVPDLKAIGGDHTLTQDNIEEIIGRGKELSWGGRSFGERGKAIFAPKGTYKFGTHTPDSLARDGLVIANHGLRGAEELGEVSTEFKNPPKIYGYNIREGEDPKQRVAFICETKHNRLAMDYNSGSFRENYAFGVLE